MSTISWILEGVVRPLLRKLIESRNLGEDSVWLQDDALQAWPPRTLEILRDSGWVVPTLFAPRMSCPTCNRDVPVVLDKRDPTNNLPVAAHFDCQSQEIHELPPGKVPKWQMTPQLLADWAARSLGLGAEAIAREQATEFFLGTCAQNKICLTISHIDALLYFENYSLLLAQFLSIEDGRLIIHREKALKFVESSDDDAFDSQVAHDCLHQLPAPLHPASTLNMNGQDRDSIIFSAYEKKREANPQAKITDLVQLVHDDPELQPYLTHLKSEKPLDFKSVRRIITKKKKR